MSITIWANWFVFSNKVFYDWNSILEVCLSCMAESRELQEANSFFKTLRCPISKVPLKWGPNISGFRLCLLALSWLCHIAWIFYRNKTRMVKTGVHGRSIHSCWVWGFLWPCSNRGVDQNKRVSERKSKYLSNVVMCIHFHQHTRDFAFLRERNRNLRRWRNEFEVISDRSVQNW